MNLTSIIHNHLEGKSGWYIQTNLGNYDRYNFEKLNWRRKTYKSFSFIKIECSSKNNFCLTYYPSTYTKGRSRGKGNPPHERKFLKWHFSLNFWTWEQKKDYQPGKFWNSPPEENCWVPRQKKPNNFFNSGVPSSMVFWIRHWPTPNLSNFL